MTERVVAARKQEMPSGFQVAHHDLSVGNIGCLRAHLQQMEFEAQFSGLMAEAVLKVRVFRTDCKLHAHRLAIQGRTVSLPPASFAYLRVLAQHAPGVVDYRTLVTEALGYDVEYREAQQLAKWHIHHIRQAIEPDARDPVFLVTVRGAGYRLVTD